MKKTLTLLLCLLSMFTFASCTQTNPESPSPSDPPKNTDWTVTAQPTCTTEGSKERYVDGSLVKEEIPALGHDFATEWTVVISATCTTDGKEQKKCSRCSEAQEQAIQAHHVLEEQQSFDIDAHYYECENCTEKFDSVEHTLSSSREYKYAYVLFAGISYPEKIEIGYVDTMTCSHCDAVIKDCKLLSKYYTNYGAYDYWAERENIAFQHYNLLHGYTTDPKVKYLNFEYDSNYNLTKVYATFVDDVGLSATNEPIRLEYDYVYEDGVLKQIKFFKNTFFAVETNFHFQYEDDKTIVSYESYGEERTRFEYDNKGQLTKKYEYVYHEVNGEQKQFVLSEFSYDSNGYITGHTHTQQNTDNPEEIFGQSQTDYVCTYDETGNLLRYDKVLRTGQLLLCYQFTYNENNQITMFFSTSGYIKCHFEYEGDKLVRWWQEDTSTSDKEVHSVTYLYGENKVEAYEEGNLVLMIEYFSGYKLAD